MNDPKRHHYIPRMLLRNFTDAGRRLYFFDKRAAGRVLQGTPESLFFEKHLYSFTEEDGTRNVDLEKEFARIEGAAKGLLVRALADVRAGAIPALDAGEKQGLEQFFYYQWKRVPEFHSKIASLQNLETRLPELIAWYERTVRSLTPEERASLTSQNGRKGIFELAKARAIADPGEPVLEVMANLGGLAFGRVTASAEFVIGSLPIVAVQHPWAKAAEIWLPIAPDVGLALTQVRGGRALFEVGDTSDIDRINQASFAQSKLTAGRSRGLLEALVKGQSSTA